MTTVYDASMGVRVAKSATEGWTFQHWWTNDYNWYPLKDAKPEMMQAMLKDSMKQLPMELRMELVDEIHKLLATPTVSSIPEVNPPTKPLVNEVNELIAKRDAEGPNSEFAQVLSAEITRGLAEIKAAIADKQDRVSVISAEEFTNNLAQLNVGMGLLGIKLVDSLGQTEPDSIKMGLDVHGFKIFEMHFPDGDKYEVVVRQSKTDGTVRSFSYKL